MSDCSKHKEWVEKYPGSLEELAEDIGNLHYEALMDFLAHLSTKLYEDSEKDRAGGRVQLADKLAKASESAGDTSYQIFNAWKICKPYMENDNETTSKKTN